MNKKISLDFTIVFTSNCNLSCKYCSLIKQNKNITFKTLDNYIMFFTNNKCFLKKYVYEIEFLLFGGEPLLEFEKIKYFINRMCNFSIKTRFKIYTNVLHLNEKKISYFDNYNDIVSFYLSIDGNLDNMLGNRLKNINQFNKILYNIKLLKKTSIKYYIVKVIQENNSIDLFKNLLFLHNIGANKLYSYLVSFNYQGGISKKQIIEIIKGFDNFINYLLTSEGYSIEKIISYLGIDQYINDVNGTGIMDISLIGDYTGKVYGFLEAISIFSIYKTFKYEEMEKIEIGYIKDNKNLLNILSNYKSWEINIQKIISNWYNREYSNELYIYSYFISYFKKKFRN